MGDWHYNQYPPWEANRENSGRSRPDYPFYNGQSSRDNQQYVGFQDFLNQYQQSNYSNNYHGQNYSNYPTAQGNNYSYNRTQYDGSFQPESARKFTPGPLNHVNNVAGHSSNFTRNDERNRPEVQATNVSQSKLTPTAVEFVPKSTISDNLVNLNLNTENSHNNNRRLNSPSYSGSNSKPKSRPNDGNRNYNHRRQPNSPIHSLVFENQQFDPVSNDGEPSQNSYGARDANPRFNKKPAYSNKAKYGEYERGNKNRQNRGDDSKYFRSKSFNSNEMFRQRDSRRTYDDDQDSFKRNRSGQLNFRRKEGSPDLKNVDETEVCQRDRLTEQLNKGALECLVCCEVIRQPDSVWSCPNCFHVLHLQCTIRWAKSSLSEGAWRCPACQHHNSSVPNKYRCFCGKIINPEWVRGGDSAHTCGNICGRLPTGCTKHPCTLLCHAGPCPQCDVIVKKKCQCGATTRSLKCSWTQPLLCGQPCDKLLNCQTHKCTKNCHPDSCEPCEITIDQECYCPKKNSRSMPCTSSTVNVTSFSCGETCGKTLNCGNHNCKKICHTGPCDECELLPENVKMCPCGQTELTSEQGRTSCLDEIPLCDKICSKQFKCGPADYNHICTSTCHHGECPTCPERTSVPCRCGNINTELPCMKLAAERDNVRCKKKCSKKQSCGRHRCKTLCCVDTDHRCPLPCNRNLTCGLHKCEDTCHSGHCDACWRASFDELHCRCGAAVRYPPVPCGTKPPQCNLDCSLPRPCGHPVLHSCHPEPSVCPPCTVLTQRYCHGRHKMRKTIPCHQDEFSCGLPCGKELPCKKHKCIEICHKGNCPTVCAQPCETVRGVCGHTCSGTCGHGDPCPIVAPCKKPVNVSCLCGRRTAVKTCAEHLREVHKIQAGTGMLEGSMGKPIDVKALIAKGNTTMIMDCDDECYVEERNRRMAIGLQIRNPDVSSKLMPRYSDFMKQFAGRDEAFCVKIHEKLTELVLLAQKSKQKTRSHSFQPMNHSKRQFVHELCEHFGCDSKAYDTEPYRNIVATAYREKSWLPALSLLEVVRRDKGQRRVPGPVVGGSSTANSSTNAQTKTNICGTGAWATLNNYGSSESRSAASSDPVASQEPPKPKIDYFDNPPDF